MDKIADRDGAVMYYLGHCPFLPHYTASEVYVAPNGEELHESALLMRGAKAVPTFLWPRKWQQDNLGIKVQAQVIARPVKRKEKPIIDQVMDKFRVEGCPMSASELAKDLDISVSRIRDAINKLASTREIKPWGSRTNLNQPQRWIVV